MTELRPRIFASRFPLGVSEARLGVRLLMLHPRSDEGYFRSDFEHVQGMPADRLLEDIKRDSLRFVESA